MDGQYYQPLYLCIVALLSIMVFFKYNAVRSPIYKFNSGGILQLLIVLIPTIFIGLRPDWYGFVDSRNYIQYYGLILGDSFSFNPSAGNLLFDNLFNFWAANSLGCDNLFLLIAAIYFGCSYLGIRKLFPNHVIPAYLVFLAAFSTFSYATNGIKAGAASSLFIWALGYRENLKVCIPLILLSWGFHHSMIMVVAGFVLTLFVKNPKYYFYGWGFCFLMAAAHVTAFQHFFSGFTTEHGAEYLLGDGSGDGTKGGFRIDFILYSAMPVLVGYYAVFKKKLQLSKLYKDLLNLYLCLNGIWMLCMYANFTNRIAYLSWFLYPIVLIYPFLQEQWGKSRYKTFGWVMLGHLSFTLFMEFIVYG